MLALARMPLSRACLHESQVACSTLAARLTKALTSGNRRKAWAGILAIALLGVEWYGRMHWPAVEFIPCTPRDPASLVTPKLVHPPPPPSPRPLHAHVHNHTRGR